MKVTTILATAALATQCCIKNHAKGRHIKIWLNVEHCSNFQDIAKDGLTTVFEDLWLDCETLRVGGGMFGDEIAGTSCWWEVSELTYYSATLSRFKGRTAPQCSDQGFYQESVMAMAFAAGRFPSKRETNEVRIIVTVTDDKPIYSDGQINYSKWDGPSPPTIKREREPDEVFLCGSLYRPLSAKKVKATLDKHGIIPITVTIQPKVEHWMAFYEAAGYNMSRNAYIETIGRKADAVYKSSYSPIYLAAAIQRGLWKALRDLDQDGCSDSS